jgi:hypothetical protein
MSKPRYKKYWKWRQKEVARIKRRIVKSLDEIGVIVSGEWELLTTKQ